MNTYRCAGDLGDIIYTLPVVRAYGGGVYLIEAATYTRQRLTPDKWCGIDLLLKQQPYIADVAQWVGQPVTLTLNDFRARMFSTLRRGQGRERNLCDWMLETHGLPLHLKNEPWLRVDEPLRIAPVVFNRAGANRPKHAVYQNPSFPWHQVGKKYGKDAVFVGLPEEHHVFCATCWEVPFHPCKDLLEVARVIAGCDLFVGNQSAPHAIAQGLHKRVILEVWLDGPNCCFNRHGVTNVYDHNAELPDL